MESLQSRVVKLDNAKWHGGRRKKLADMIVMHATAGGSAKSSIDYLNKTTDKKASYNYIIDRDGAIYRTVPVDTVAYHAGDSAWPADHSKTKQGGTVNHRAIGIAWANKDDGEPLTPKQVESALWLCSVFVKREEILLENVVGHYEVSPGRKPDPAPAMNMDQWRALLAEYLSKE